MVCTYCKKPLPSIKEERCPNCFAEWTPYEPEKKGKAVNEDNKKEDGE